MQIARIFRAAVENLKIKIKIKSPARRPAV
jgi:hypothetical protein